MFSEEMEDLIKITLQDGVLTDQEKRVLIKRAEKEGIDLDELDVYIQSLLHGRNKAKVDAEIEAETALITKVGTKLECPNCGEKIQPGTAVCPKCGLAFNVKSELNRSAEKLQQKLQQISEAYRKPIADAANASRSDLQKQCATEKKLAIMNVIVGNSRQELLDLLAFSMPKANKTGDERGFTTNLVGDFQAEDLGVAYWNLFQNCIFLAKNGFASDPAFTHYFSFYEKENLKQPTPFWLKKNVVIRALIIGGIILFYIILYHSI